jgi:putative addiction module component (TIGR02574 family)
MATTIEKIAQQVATMTRQERLTLMRLLLDLDQPPAVDAIATAWDQEIRARVKAVDEGRAAGIPYDQIKEEMTSRFGIR